MADGNITLKLDFDNSQAKSSIQDFGNIAQKAINSADTKVQKLGLNLQNTTNKMSKLASSMSELANKRVPTAEYTALNDKIKQVSSQLKDAKSSLSQFESTSLHTEEYDYITNKIKDIKTDLENARDAYGQLIAEGKTGTAQFSAQAEEVVRYENQLKEAEEYQQRLTDAGLKYANTDEFSAKQEAVQNLETEYNNLIAKKREMESTGTDTMSGAETARYQDMANQMSYAQQQAQYMSNNISRSVSVTQTFTNTLRQGVSAINKVRTAVGNLISRMRSLATTTTSTQNKHNWSFKKMLTTVLKYGFGIRSIFLLYKKLRTTISTGLSEMSKQFSDVADDVYTLKNSWGGFKSSLVSAFQPIYSYIVPALSTLINYLTAAMNTLANFFALLTGSSTYKKAVAGNESVADSVSGTGSAAEEANEELAEYDDLIVIDQDSSSGGSGGSGSSDGSAWNWEEVSVQSSKWYDMLMDALEDWDFTELGEALGDELISMMQSIPWDDIYNTASNFGKGLATFLNGLISDDLFAELGRTIANALNTGLYFLNSFASWFDWEGLGSAISSGINSFIENYDLDLAVDTFNKWANGILTTLITAVSGVNWSGLADKIADGINGIDTSGIGEKLGKLVTAIANAVYDLVSNKDTWKNLGTKIGDGINAFFTNTEWTKLGQSINATFKGIITAIKTALDTVEWKEVGQAIADFISGLNWKDIAWDFIKLLDSAKDAIIDILDGASIDAGDIVLTVAGAAILLASITGINLAKEITKAYIKKMVETKVLSLLGSSTAAATGGTEAAAAAGTSLGTVATVLGEIALVLIAAIAGWKIGGKLYESATGYSGASQGFIDTITDLWDGLFSENKIEFDLSDFIDFTIDDVNNGTGWLKDTQLWKDLTTARDSIKSAWQSLTGTEANTKGYNGAPSEAVDYITRTGQDSEYSSNYWSSLGENIVTGIAKGIKVSLQTNPFTAPVVAIYDAIKNALANKFKSHSPAKAMYEDGENILMGILVGMINAITHIPQYVAQLYNEFKSKIKQKFGSLKLTDIVKGIGNVAVTITTTLLGGLTKLADYLGLDEALSNIKTKYKNMKAKLTTTLSGAVQKIKGTASNTLETLSTTWSNLKKNWSNAKATLSAYVGGQMSGSSDISNWTSLYSGLKNSWTSTSATVSAYVGGQLSNIKDINGNKGSWTEVYTNFKNNTWTDATATVKANADVGGKSDPNLSRMSTNGDWTTTFTNFAKKVWVGTTATFNSEYKNSDTNSTGYKNFKSVYDKWTGRTASFTSTYQGSTSDKGYKNFSNLWSNWYGRTAKFTAEFEGATSVTKVANTALEKVYTALEKNGYKVTKKVWAAKGGVITGLTNLTDIMTGEAGAEAIVPLERNLGWLDKMAGMITDRLTETPIPFIANGNILPITDAFMKSTIEVMDNSKIAQLLESILNRIDNLESSNNAPIMIQLDGRTIAEVVWDETEKRYRQTGKVYSFA